MNNRVKYLYVAVLVITGILLTVSIIEHFNDQFGLTLNFYAGIIYWMTVVILTLLNNKSAKFLTIFILVLSSFNIISFTVANISFGSSTIYHYDDFLYVLPGLNPFFIIALITFSIVDTTISRRFYNNLFYGSDEEKKENYQREAKFYFEKFSNCSDEEFKYALKNIKDYPKPAQDAISVISAQKADSVTVK